MVAWVWIVAFVVGVAGVVAARWRGQKLLAGVLKVACSLGFCALGLAGGVVDARYGGCMLVGLGLSALGDAILLVRNRRGLVVGAGAFALAHVAYLAAWVPWVALRWPVVLLGLALGIAVPVVAYRTRERTGSARWVVLGYGWVLAASVVAALGAGLGAGGTTGWLLGIGGVSFFVSDLSVLRDRLLTPSLWNPTWGLPCYYAAQVCFALTVGQVGPVP
ncbi:MAG: lysoplasmalogenase [Planctomycetota bacterium]